MSISTDIQEIRRAEAKRHGSFDGVSIYTDAPIGRAVLYLPLGTGQSVADAINAAVAK